jgi:hypothetical protein
MGIITRVLSETSRPSSEKRLDGSASLGGLIDQWKMGIGKQKRLGGSAAPSRAAVLQISGRVQWDSGSITRGRAREAGMSCLLSEKRGWMRLFAGT